MSDVGSAPIRPVGSEVRRALLAIALGVGLGVLARVFETKEARAWREPSAT